MPSISKSYGVWRVRIRRRGLPIISKVFKAKADAHAWAFKTERSMELGFLSPNHDCLLKALLERYRREITPTKHGATQEIYRINKLCRHSIAMIRLSTLTSNDIAKFRDERLKTVSGTTVVKDLLLISHAIKTAQREWGFRLPSNPVHNVDKPPVNKPRDRRLEEG
ncbi:MAG: site-specific integrase, partial [Alphaproteobacteria bacterium]